MDPDARTLEALKLSAGRWIEVGAYGDRADTRIAPFTEFVLAVGRLFLPPDADDALREAE